MALLRTVWGGHFYDSQTAGTAIEEWSCTLSHLVSPVPNLASALSNIQFHLINYHKDAATKIDSTCALEFIKVNEFDPTTGLQITDPTVESEFTSTEHRGAGLTASKNPVSAAYRVSLGIGTRARTGKGGFFVPRPSALAGLNGRFAPADVVGMANSAKILIDNLNSGGYTVGIWSRKLNAVQAVTQLRVGNVPDNISRRRGDMLEVYETRTIT